MFADDTAFVAHTHQDMQDIVTRFATTAKAYGLQINIKKTEMMFQPSPGTDGTYQPIQVQGEDLAAVKEFKYLGSTVAYNNKLDAELQLHKSKASQAFGRLKERVWSNKDQMHSISCYCSVNSSIWSRVLDSLHGSSAQPKCLLDATSKTDSGCQMVASCLQQSHSRENEHTQHV
ncbi:Uncharacterised protein at_DN1484 [Pycnogonum litorale]